MAVQRVRPTSSRVLAVSRPSANSTAAAMMLLTWLCLIQQVIKPPITAGSPISSAGKAAESISTCDFFGTTHQVGDRWQTKSDFDTAPSSGGCMTCKCHQAGMMECEHTPFQYDSQECRKQCSLTSPATARPDSPTSAAATVISPLEFTDLAHQQPRPSRLLPPFGDGDDDNDENSSSSSAADVERLLSTDDGQVLPAAGSSNRLHQQQQQQQQQRAYHHHHHHHAAVHSSSYSTASSSNQHCCPPCAADLDNQQNHAKPIVSAAQHRNRRAADDEDDDGDGAVRMDEKKTFYYVHSSTGWSYSPAAAAAMGEEDDDDEDSSSATTNAAASGPFSSPHHHHHHQQQQQQHHENERPKRRRKSASPVADPLSQLSHERDQQQHQHQHQQQRNNKPAAPITGSELCTHDGKVYSPGDSLIMTAGGAHAGNGGHAGGSSSTASGNSNNKQASQANSNAAAAAASNNSSTNPKDTHQQCFQCRCSHGRLWCHPETCPPLKCKNAIRIANSCCPICRDDAPAEDASSAFQTQHRSKLSTITADGTHPLAPPPSAAGGHQPSIISGSLMYVTNPSSEISVAPTAPSPNGQDCYSGGRRFQHGSEWHPMIGPFGEMECVLCGCDTGQISCHRLFCPSAEELDCKTELAKVAGRCCPSCLDDEYGDRASPDTINVPLAIPTAESRPSGSGPHNNGGSGTDKKVNHSQHQQQQHQRKNHSSKGRVDNSQNHRDLDENAGDDDGQKGGADRGNKERSPFAVCSPPGTDVVAYLIADTFQNGTRTITYVFHKKNVTKPYSKPVEKHKWTLDRKPALHAAAAAGQPPAVSSYGAFDNDHQQALLVEPHKFETFYEGLGSLESLKDDERLPMTILGSTSSKYLERFTKKEKKLDSRCTRRCHERVRKLEAFLRLRPIHYRRQCHSNEVSLS